MTSCFLNFENSGFFAKISVFLLQKFQGFLQKFRSLPGSRIIKRKQIKTLGSIVVGYKRRELVVVGRGFQTVFFNSTLRLLSATRDSSGLLSAARDVSWLLSATRDLSWLSSAARDLA